MSVGFIESLELQALPAVVEQAGSLPVSGDIFESTQITTLQDRAQGFKDCLASSKLHLDFVSRRYPDACTDKFHISLLDAMAETDY